MAGTEGLPRLFTPAEVAEAIGQTERYVADKARAREWPHRRYARGQVRFTADDYARVLELAAVPVAAPAATRLSFAPRSGRRRAS